MTHKIFLLLSLAAFLFAACSGEDASTPASVAEKSNTLNIQTKQDQWTYVSMSSGKVVGTSALGDSVAEASWKNRTDWDIAVCNGIIRTNSGTSGNGEGGIVNSSVSYEETANVPDTRYHVDVDTLQVW